MTDALAHWPFVVFTLIAATVMQVFKGAVWTAAHAEGTGVRAGFFWWARKTLPLHPVVMGGLFGLIPGLPLSPGMEHTMATAAMYYAAAGLCSTWAFDVLRGLAKKRGIPLQVGSSIVGTSFPIPPPPHPPKVYMPPPTEPPDLGGTKP